MRLWLLIAIVCISLLTLPAIVTFAAEDVIDDEDDSRVEDEPANTPPEAESSVTQNKDRDAEDPVDEPTTSVGSSPDAFVTLLFTHPPTGRELGAGKVTKFLIGFQNRGEKDFTVKYAETSFRYPQDFSYYIQNFTLAKYDIIVPPKREATFDYAFFPSENYAGRPLGLVVNLRYEDSDGVLFETTAFNDTVTITEDESSFNTETGFLYVVFGCVAILLMLVGQQLLSKMRRKHGMTKSRAPAPVETGTSNKNEVDFEWIPREVLLSSNKSPKNGTPNSRNRKLRRE